MGLDVQPQQLTPLERLQLRDALQDRWREQVRQITLLSLARYDFEDAEQVSLAAGALTEESSLDWSIARARARLEDLEKAMRRLDDRSYGRCLRCGEPIGFTRLAQTPEESNCGNCPYGAAALPNRSDDVSVT